MAVTTEHLRLLAQSDQLTALAADLREQLGEAVWDRVNEYAMGLVTFTRLSVEMVRAHHRTGSRTFRLQYRRLTKPEGFCCAIRLDGTPCQAQARYLHDDQTRTCGNHKTRGWVTDGEAQP